jgi:hypothetical protein
MAQACIAKPRETRRDVEISAVAQCTISMHAAVKYNYNRFSSVLNVGAGNAFMGFISY